STSTEDNKEVFEIETSHYLSDRRHDDVAHKRCHDGSERGADNDADCEIQNITAHREFFELFEHDVPPNDLSDSVLCLQKFEQSFIKQIGRFEVRNVADAGQKHRFTLQHRVAHACASSSTSEIATDHTTSIRKLAADGADDTNSGRRWRG